MRKLAVLLFAFAVLGCGQSQPGPGNGSNAEGSMTAQKWFAQGNDLRESNKEGAVKAYTEAIALDASMDAAYFNRALTLAELSRDKEAAADKDLLLQRGSDLGAKLKGLFAMNAAAQVSMGNAAIGKGDWDLALKKYDLALVYDPSSADAHVGRGLVCAIRKTMEEAILEFDRAIQLNPKSAPAYHNRGKANLAKSQFQAAADDFTKAIELDPNQSSTYEERAKAFEKLGDTAKAAEDSKKATQLKAQSKQKPQ